MAEGERERERGEGDFRGGIHTVCHLKECCTGKQDEAGTLLSRNCESPLGLLHRGGVVGDGSYGADVHSRR